MGRLRESVEGLREAIKQQEKHISNYINSPGPQDAQLLPSKDHVAHLSTPDQDHQLNLHVTESNISQESNWSNSLSLISSTIGDLKNALQNQDDQVSALLLDNEQLRNMLRKKEKELKKQNFLLKAERAAFEQFKKDTCKDVKRFKSADNLEENPGKTLKEIVKLKSELSHYIQLCSEQQHTAHRLSRTISGLNNEKYELRVKLYQQVGRYNKLISEMVQRFNISKNEMRLVSSEQFEDSISVKNPIVGKISERNVRLAHDNCMLKFEIKNVRGQLFEIEPRGSKLLRSLTLSKEDYKTVDLVVPEEKPLIGAYNKGCALKASMSEKSGLAIPKQNLKVAIKSSLTSLAKNGSAEVENKQKSIDREQWDWIIRSYQEVEVSRTESAPQLQLGQ